MLKLFHSLDLKLKSCLIALFGSAFLAFGLYHVHSFSGVTEGGVLGMTLLLEHWFHISPSVSGFIMNGSGDSLTLAEGAVPVLGTLTLTEVKA